jgi:riboflavin kinase/FMN adenylyltransferase
MISVYSDVSNLPVAAKGAVLVIGNFDGMHKGHQALFQRAREIADRHGLPLAVMTFEPHPREFFKPEEPPFRLTLLPTKLRLFEAQGVRHVFVPVFDKAFASLSAEEFILVLTQQLHARHIVVGHDFAFGKGAKGNAALLNDTIHTTVVDAVICPQTLIYSSTRIREKLKEKDFAAAAAMLGWEWEMESPVIHGEKRGRTIGYPTANQKVASYLQLPFGVYAVEVQIEGEKDYRQGVANFGIRPMFKVEEPLLETYIFDFDAEIYGKNMRVRPIQYIRDEMSLADLGALKEQIKQDCQAARACLSFRITR